MSRRNDLVSTLTIEEYITIHITAGMIVHSDRLSHDAYEDIKEMKISGLLDELDGKPEDDDR